MESQAVSIAPYQRGMAGRLVQLANNAHVAAHVRDAFPHPYTIADAHYWIDICLGSPINQKAFQRAVLLDGEMVGGIGVLRQDDIYQNSAEIGYWLGEPYWGRNIMTRALTQMTRWIFDNTTIVRLYAGVFENNPASMRVLEKAGYEKEAIHRKAITKYGQLLDEHLYTCFSDKIL